ncbi:MAG TPA: GNAT family N-acetyltransferase [Thermoplasmata archaeon]|nr:GNAT family N-acetyltransferase [Thermoplasmata archaeon]
MEKRPENSSGTPPAAPPGNGAGLVIGRLTHEDVGDSVQLFRRVWEPFLAGLPVEVQKTWQPTALEFTSSMEGVTYFAARRDNKLVGVVGCRLTAGACQLLNLCVDAEFRRRGTGTALLAAALGWAQHANARSLCVDVMDRFGDAMALLKASGFTQAGVLHRHFWGEDVRMFEKVL